MKFYNIKISFQGIVLFLSALIGIIYIHYTLTSAEKNVILSTQLESSIVGILIVNENAMIISQIQLKKKIFWS